MGIIEDMAATGASLATIDARLSLPPNTMARLLDKGRVTKRGPYRDFYLKFRAWAAEARHCAESSMMKKTPEKWLDRNTSARRLESEEDRKLAVSTNLQQGTIPGVEAGKVLEALKELRKSGISLDEAFDKGIEVDPSKLEDHTND